MKKISYILLIVHILLLGTSLKAQLPAALESRLQFVMDSTCARHRIKGASVAVLVPRNGVWTGTWGESHAGSPITRNMVFDVASNTKTYVAALMLKLQEMGKLNLDDSIGRWIHHVPNVNGQATIRQVLNHTSGIGHYEGGKVGDAYNDSIFKDFNRVWQPEELLAKFPVTAPKFAPGKGWDYSNTNFVIAALIIKQVMNQPVSRTFRELILDPHGLGRTFFFPDDPRPDAPFPHIWSMNAGSGKIQLDFMATYGYSNTSLITSGYGCGGMVTTAEDNVLFWHKLFSGQILNAASLAEMTTFVDLGKGWQYGLGLYRGQRDVNNRVVYEHGGTSVGFVCENIVDSASGVCVTVLTNQDSIKNDILLMRVVAALHKVMLQSPVTGVSEKLHSNVSMQLYPNPAADFVQVDVTGTHPGLRFAVYNLQGEKLLEETLDRGIATINTRSLPAGIYITHATDREGKLLQSRRLVIAR